MFFSGQMGNTYVVRIPTHTILLCKHFHKSCSPCYGDDYPFQLLLTNMVGEEATYIGNKNGGLGGPGFGGVERFHLRTYLMLPEFLCQLVHPVSKINTKSRQGF